MTTPTPTQPPAATPTPKATPTSAPTPAAVSTASTESSSQHRGLVEKVADSWFAFYAASTLGFFLWAALTAIVVRIAWEAARAALSKDLDQWRTLTSFIGKSVRGVGKFFIVLASRDIKIKDVIELTSTSSQALADANTRIEALTEELATVNDIIIELTNRLSAIEDRVQVPEGGQGV